MKRIGGAIILTSRCTEPHHRYANQVCGGPTRILLIQRGGRAPVAPYEWGVPAGIHDPEEDRSIQDTAQRETREETGAGQEGMGVHFIPEDEVFWTGVWQHPKTKGERELNYFLGNWRFVGEKLGICLEWEACGFGFFTYEEAIKLPLALRYLEVLEALHKADLL